MGRPSKTAQEEGYVRSFWEEVRSIEADFQGVAMVTLVPSRRTGVVVVRIAFTPFFDTADNPLGSHALQIEYPNGSTQTLAGALWSAAMKLYATVSEDWHNKNPRAKKVH